MTYAKAWIPSNNCFDGCTMSPYGAVKFTEMKKIYGLRMSRGQEGGCCNDRYSGTVYVDFTAAEYPDGDTPEEKWCTLGEFTRTSRFNHWYIFPTAVDATAIRL